MMEAEAEWLFCIVVVPLEHHICHSPTRNGLCRFVGWYVNKCYLMFSTCYMYV